MSHVIAITLMFAMFAALRAISSAQLEVFYVDLIKYTDGSIGPILDNFVKSIESSSAIKQSVGDIFTSLFSNPENERLITQLSEVVGNANMTTIIDTIKNISTAQALIFFKTSESSISFYGLRMYGYGFSTKGYNR